MMENALQTHLRELQQKPEPDRSYPESVTIEMLQDLEKLYEQGASKKEMRRRISETTTKLKEHADATERNLEIHRLWQEKREVREQLDMLKAEADSIAVSLLESSSFNSKGTNTS
jgi:hypothetical protein